MRYSRDPSKILTCNQLEVDLQTFELRDFCTVDSLYPIIGKPTTQHDYENFFSICYEVNPSSSPHDVHLVAQMGGSDIIIQPALVSRVLQLVSKTQNRSSTKIQAQIEKKVESIRRIS